MLQTIKQNCIAQGVQLLLPLGPRVPVPSLKVWFVRENSCKNQYFQVRTRIWPRTNEPSSNRLRNRSLAGPLPDARMLSCRFNPPPICTLSRRYLKSSRASLDSLDMTLLLLYGYSLKRLSPQSGLILTAEVFAQNRQVLSVGQSPVNLHKQSLWRRCTTVT